MKMEGVGKERGWKRRPSFSRCATSRRGPPSRRPRAASPVRVSGCARSCLRASARALRDARGFQRYHSQFTVRFRTAREFVREHAQNISRGGVFIQTRTPPEVDEVITVQLELPDGGPSATTSGLVMHRVTEGEAAEQGIVPGIGVQFLDADDRFRDHIDRYLAKLGVAPA